ncbi:MAG: hypothetical protein LBS01_07545 [Prevotellaceae bacterium]|jgi:hypothetical protein|nr:hypothetical protein [Prevotellaceae bacterium]
MRNELLIFRLLKYIEKGNSASKKELTGKLGFKSNKKYFWIVKNAEHGGSNGPEYKNFKKWRKKVLNFYNKNLK